MIEKKDEHSPKSNSSRLLKDDEIEIPRNFKLLYRNMTNPEGDKTSVVSSDDDEETTSSSLAPIPDSLKQLRNKSKWAACDGRELSANVHNDAEDLEQSPENIMTSLDEIRKKYTLKNESSVTLKMNSVNLMLDDILNNSNINKSSSGNCPPMFSRKEEFRQKTDTESEISTTGTTETSVSRIQSCAQADHCHPPLPSSIYPIPCLGHCAALQNLHNSSEKVSYVGKTDLESINNQKKKSLLEKFQDLQLRYKIQSVYKTFQKTRNPFTKVRKDCENNNIQQGIPGVGCQGDRLRECPSSEYKCACEAYDNHNQLPKKMILDLITLSETSQSETKNTEREECHCNFIDQKKCCCPEVIPQCFCVQHIQVTSNNAKQNSSNSDFPSRINEGTHGTQSIPPNLSNHETESSLLPNKENPDKQNQKSIPKNTRGGWKSCSRVKNVVERTDIYYFDHGNSAYYQTTDNHPMRYTECLVERTDEYATKFWAEFFGTFEIGMAFLISFILQLYRFLFTSIIRSLTVGLLQIFSDYFFKPLLTILFNGIIQPCLILVYNIATSLRDLCLPISETFGFFAKEVANILRACRLVDINYNKQSSCNCENKV